MSKLFISDLHLQEKRPDISQAFFDFLEEKALHAHQLYILGDLFEYWIGDDAMSPFQMKIVTALAKLSNQCDLFYLHGNRDFLIGDRFADQTNAMLLNDPTLISLYGKGCVLMHGDSLCTSDQAYMKFREQVRDPAWQQAFLAKPIVERLQIAQQLRDTSQQETAAKDLTITDVSPEAVSEVFTNHPCELLIHGHTHRPYCHDLNVNEQAVKRLVLGDWGTTGWYIEVDYEGAKLHEFIPKRLKESSNHI